MKKNIYILYEAQNVKTNGIGTYIRELTRCLLQMDVNICHIAYCHESKMFEIELENGIIQMKIPFISSFCDNHYSEFDKLLRLHIKDDKENIFFFNYTPHDLLVDKVKKSFPLSKLIFVIHDMTWTTHMQGDKNKLIKWAILKKEEQKKYSKSLISLFNREKKMYETVHQIVSLNTETVELLQSLYKINQKKISFIPNGIQDSYIQLSKKTINQLKAKRLIAPKEKIILFSGRVLHVKGIYRILNSLKKVVRVYPNFRLVIAGTVFSSKMVMECANSIALKVVFLGQISKDEMNEWYQIADIGTLASYYEQCSYTGIEMMMHGLPIVASDGFCMNDMFVNNKNAKIAHIGDRNTPESFENDLSDIFIELLRSNKECKRLGKNGRKIYESRYQIKYMKEKYQTFFENIS